MRVGYTSGVGSDMPPVPENQSASRLRGSIWRWLAITAVLVAVGVWNLAEAANLTFLGDDTWLIQSVAHGSAWGDYSGVGTQFLRPASALFLWVQYQAFGSDPTGYHLVSIAFNLLNTVAVGVLTAQTLRAISKATATRALARWAGAGGLTASAVFLLHPSHGEAMYWIGAQPDLLATFFSLVAFIALLRGLHGRRTWRVVSVASITLALLCKESAVGSLLALGFVSVVVAWFVRPAVFDRGQRMRVAARQAMPYALVALAYAALRWTVLGTPVGGYGSGAYLDQSFPGLVGHVGLAGARTVLPAMPISAWFVSAVVALGLVATAWFRWERGPSPSRQLPAFLVLVGIVALVLVPVAPLGVSAFGALGERNIYMPSAFMCILLAGAAVLLVPRFRSGSLLAGTFVLLLLGGVAIREATRWSDASRAAESITTCLRDVDTSEVLLLNVPDTVRGAVAFRNSAAGLGVYGGYLATLDVRTVTTRAFARPRETDSATALEDGRKASVKVSDPTTGGPTNPSESATGPWTVAVTGDATYEVSFGASADPRSVLFFTDGKLRRIG